jgi:hypothetical protein
MSRVVRLLVTIALALAVLLGRGAAWADPPMLVAPNDVAPVQPMVHLSVPPVPLEFATRDLGWLVVRFPPGVHEQVDELVAEADEVKAKLSTVLGQRVLDHVELRVAGDPEGMAALAPRDAPPFEYASAMAYSNDHLILISMQAPGTAESVDLPVTFRHELTHIALYDAVLGHHLPRWFDEGLAVFESGEAGHARSEALRQASLSRSLLPIEELDRFPSKGYEVSVAYAESADFVRFLARSPDKARFASLVDRVREGTPFDRALGDAYGAGLRTLDYEWREELSKRFSPLTALADGAFVWVILAALMGIAWYRRRRARKEKIDEWEREDATREALLRAVHAREIPDEGAAQTGEPATMRPPVPMVEHEGTWHTLH